MICFSAWWLLAIPVIGVVAPVSYVIWALNFGQIWRR